VVPPDAVKVALLPKQKLVGGPTVITGSAFMRTPTVSVPRQPFVSTPVTVYNVVDETVEVVLEQVEHERPVDGVHV
jgi:hypothetical protein